MALNSVPLWPADGAQQDRIGLTGTGQRCVRQRYPMDIQGSATEQTVFNLKIQTEALVDNSEHFLRLRHDLRANVIAGQYQYLCRHVVPPY